MRLFPISDGIFMSANILVVDDLEANRDMLARRLQQLGHLVKSAESGADALQRLEDFAIDLVLLDLMMPEMDGIEVVRRMKADTRFASIPVVMVSANDEMDNVVRCIEMGAEDYLPKPFNPVLLRARVEACLQKKRAHDYEVKQQRNLEEKVKAQVQEISSAQLAAIFAMSKLAAARCTESGTHLERTREYCRVIAQQMASTPKYKKIIDDAFIDALYAAALLHDIGKVGIPDHILNQPNVDMNEWEVLKTHPLIGSETLRAVEAQHPGIILIRMGIDIVEAHHEKWDASGYPYGLRGESIPLAARIMALADAYDGLTSAHENRCFFSHEEARQMIELGAGRHFDPDVVEAFIKIEMEMMRIRRQHADDGLGRDYTRGISRPDPDIDAPIQRASI